MKKKLAFVFLVVLALASFNVLALPHASAQSSSVAVLSYTSYVAPSTTTTAEFIGDLVVVGEVQNTGSSSVGSVWVMGQAYDSNGTFLASTESQAMLYSLAPKQKAPFYLDFVPENSISQDQSWVPDASNITVTIATILNSTNTSQYSGLTTFGDSGINNGGTYTVNGNIMNSGSQNVGDIAVVATFYSADGKVVGVSFSDLGKALAVGQSTSFAVTPADDTSSLSSTIQSYTIQLLSTPATTTPQPTAAPTAQPTASPTVPIPTENTGQAAPISTYVIVILVALVIVIIVLLMLVFRRGKRQQPEASASPSQPDTQI